MVTIVSYILFFSSTLSSYLSIAPIYYYKTMFYSLFILVFTH